MQQKQTSPRSSAPAAAPVSRPLEPGEGPPWPPERAQTRLRGGGDSEPGAPGQRARGVFRPEAPGSRGSLGPTRTPIGSDFARNLGSDASPEELAKFFHGRQPGTQLTIWAPRPMREVRI